MASDIAKAGGDARKLVINLAPITDNGPVHDERGFHSLQVDHAEYVLAALMPLAGRLDTITICFDGVPYRGWRRN